MRAESTEGRGENVRPMPGVHNRMVPKEQGGARMSEDREVVIGGMSLPVGHGGDVRYFARRGGRMVCISTDPRAVDASLRLYEGAGFVVEAPWWPEVAR